MRVSRHVGRSLLSSSLVLLLFAPLLVGGHAHVADHDGGEHHVDAPHGAHEVSLTDDRDRMPSTQVTFGLDAARTPAPDFAAPATISEILSDLASWVPTARGPPSSLRSRAPPLLS